jgi:membrane protein
MVVSTRVTTTGDSVTRAAADSTSHGRAKPELRQATVRYLDLVKKILTDSFADDCPDLAAQMSFYFALSIFPFFIVVAALIGWLPSTTLWQSFAQWITAYLPTQSRRVIFETILGLSHGYTGFLSFGLLATLWTASSGIVSLMESLSVAYGGQDTRSYWKKRGIAVIATMLMAIFMIASFGLLAASRRAALSVSNLVGTASTFHLEWVLLRWLATFALLCFAIDCVNYFLPKSSRRWRWLSPGTLVVAFGVFGSLQAFNLYLRYFSNFPRVYGALAGFIMLMVWIYFLSLILLVGAETDRIIESRHRAGTRA